MRIGVYLLFCLMVSCVGISNDPVEEPDWDTGHSAEYVLANVSGETPEAHYLRARAYVELGQLDNATGELTAEVMQRTADARYSFLAGKVSYLQDNYQLAQRQLREALELGYNQPELFRLLANTYLRLDYNSRALATADRLLAMDRTPENETLKGKVLLVLGDTTQAESLFRGSMQQDSSLTANFYELLNIYAARENETQTGMLIDRYLARYPEDREMLSRKANRFLRQERYAEARSIYTDLMEQEPRNAYYLQQHSKSYFLEGRYDSALIQSRRALVLDENDLETRLIEARSLENQRLYDEAKSAYASMLAADSSITQAMEGYERLIRRENYLRYLREQERRKQEMAMPELQPINPIDDNGRQP